MASWIMHLAVAKEVSKHFNLDMDRFYLGNLLPDASSQDRLSKDDLHFRIKREPYEFSSSEYYQYYDYEAFLRKYKNKLDDDLYLGYFSHLLTDEIWIQQIYIKYMRDENRRKRVDQQSNYYHDYDLLNDIIESKYNLDIAEIISGIKTIENVELFESIELSEVYSILESLAYYSAQVHENKTLHLFDDTDVVKFMECAADQVVNVILRKGLRQPG